MPDLDKSITHTKTVISQLEASMCPICYEYKLDVDLVKTGCQHVFCKECIADWVQHGEDKEVNRNGSHTCPYCRHSGTYFWDLSNLNRLIKEKRQANAANTQSNTANAQPNTANVQPNTANVQTDMANTQPNAENTAEVGRYKPVTEMSDLWNVANRISVSGMLAFRCPGETISRCLSGLARNGTSLRDAADYLSFNPEVNDDWQVDMETGALYQNGLLV